MAAREEDTGNIQHRQKDRAAVLPMVLIVLFSSAVGIVLGLLIDWFPTPASTQADPIDTLWDVLVIASVPVFVGVQAFVLYCVWRFRMRPGQELQDGPPIHGNTRLEVVWTVIPAVLILGLCTYAYFVLEDIEEAKANEWRINVVGQQFTWTFEYPEAITGGKPIRTAQLYVPKDQPVHFYVKSQDVLHDFWVPAWRMKIDAVPGMETRYRVTPNRTGRFSVVCAELCGIGHAYMRQTANVVSREDFDRWLEEKKSRGGTAGGGTAGGEEVDGKTLFAEGNGEATACGACHTLSDAGTSGTTGPDLDEALRGMTADEIRKQIADPNSEIAEGFGEGIMPDNYEQLLSPEELDALVKYLEGVSK
ncbi:MAG TPA: cytochrome c oxidase subunit II [Solirubrobacteraceae bacterium]|jgi:cytochrome c oxidase subunit 2|nr:cytochrome c oxidase subunit II [Solirubrobacteraceae bacterium]